MLRVFIHGLAYVHLCGELPLVKCTQWEDTMCYCGGTLLIGQQFSTCGLRPIWQTSISKNIYIVIHNSINITVIK